MVPRLNLAEARNMVAASVALGGMIPKIEASLRALTTTQVVHIIDGRASHALLKAIAGNEIPCLSSEQAQFGGTSIVPG